MADDVHGRRYRDNREVKRQEWKRARRPCEICHQAIDYDAPSTNPQHFQLDHIKSRRRFPHLANDPMNWQPAHADCNKRKHTSDQAADTGVTSESW